MVLNTPTQIIKMVLLDVKWNRIIAVMIWYEYNGNDLIGA